MPSIELVWKSRATGEEAVLAHRGSQADAIAAMKKLRDGGKIDGDSGQVRELMPHQITSTRLGVYELTEARLAT